MEAKKSEKADNNMRKLSSLRKPGLGTWLFRPISLTPYHMHIASYKTQNEISSSKSIFMTEKCAEKIKQKIEKGNLLRLQVDAGGCSGFQYVFDEESPTRLTDEDIIFERDGAKLVVDDITLQKIAGSVVDFEQSMLESVFRVRDNPQAVAGCGCGVSFDVKQ